MVNSFRFLSVFTLMAIFILTGIVAAAPPKPTTVAELALYDGPDREKILEEGARKEGQLIFYHSWSTGFPTVIREFEKKYPFVKISATRTSSQKLYKRIVEEYAAGLFTTDVVETTDLMVFIHRKGILQEYYYPHQHYYPDEYKKKGETGTYYLADREIYIGLGFNTERISSIEAPKSLKDLLDSRWKGKMSITGTKTGLTWLGNALEVMGLEYIKRLSSQDVNVQNISGGALAGLVADGEVPMSPCVFNDRFSMLVKKGAPVEWRPLEPVVTNIGFSGLTTKAPNPHAALLFLDYIHSREGQQVVMKMGSNSPRNDMGFPAMHFKKTIWTSKYSPEEFANKMEEWEKLRIKFFIRR